MSKQVRIEEYCDWFSIVIYNNNTKKEEEFHFDQEDNKENLVAVFRELGYDATYEEIY